MIEKIVLFILNFKLYGYLLFDVKKNRLKNYIVLLKYFYMGLNK